MTVGIVVVSHSARLAEGAAELAREMASSAVKLAVAAGMDDAAHALGCDPLRVRAAIGEVDDDDGVLVLMDLGSALLSAEFARDLLEPDQQRRVQLCDAPLVEGLVAAAVASMTGASLGEVAAHARAALDAKREHLAGADPAPAGAPESVDAPRPQDDAQAVATFTVSTAHGLHARPAAAIVRAVSGRRATATLRNLTTDSGPVPAASLNGILMLGARHGHLIRVEASGSDAAVLVAELQRLAGRGFEQESPGRPAPAAVLDAPPAQRASGPAQGDSSAVLLTGLTAAPGLGLGTARHLLHNHPNGVVRVDASQPAPAGGPQDLKQRLHAAVDAVVNSLRQAIARNREPEIVAILESQLLTLSDPLVIRAAEDLVDRAGYPVLEAWRVACDEVIARIGRLGDPYLAARAADLTAMRDEVAARLQGAGDLADLAGVLLGRELSPMEAASLDPEKVTAVVTADGSPSAHSAMILRAAGIPAVVGVGPAILATPEGSTLVVDADAATVETSPSAATQAAVIRRIERRRADTLAAEAAAGRAAVTLDGVHIRVVANIARLADVHRAAAAGADGVGLVRSEFIFAERSAPPTEDEQVAIYEQICSAFPGRHVVLRTLDVGGDKPLDYLDVPREANPFLGLRGIRLTLRRPSLMMPQLRAALRTAAGHELRLMLPMVSVADEIRHARDLIRQASADLAPTGIDAGHIPLGIMVETPAAALKAATLLREVDFVSIGTNDLTQYTLAAERGNADVAHLVRECDPSVLRLVATVCAAAADLGVPVAVCGAAAENLSLVPLLVGLGVRELSVSPPSVAAVKAEVRRLDAGAAARTAARAVDAGTAEEVLALVGQLTADAAAGKNES